MTSIYELELHDTLNIDKEWYVLRVPGGWIYINTVPDEKNLMITQTFVPFDNEFQMKPKKEEKPSKPEATQDPEHPLQKYVRENYPRVASMKKQLTAKEAMALVATYDKILIDDKLGAMENTSNLQTKYVSVYLTVNNWCKMALERRGESVPGKPKTDKLDMMAAGEKLASTK